MKLLINCLLLCLATALNAAELNPFFSSRMVLQRDAPVRIYGTGSDGETLSVAFKGQLENAVVADGKWELFLAAMPADVEGAELVLTSGETRTALDDVLVGDVWILGGQSNMHRGFKAYPQLAKVPSQAKHPLLRIVGIDPRIGETPEPVDHFTFTQGAAWRRAVYGDDALTDQLLANYSPAGYFFGVKLQEHLQVPVGLVLASLGASAAECWTPREVLQNDPRLRFHLEADQDIKPGDKNANKKHTSWLYNGVLHPITKSTIKGVLWYQGESNAKNAETYSILFPAMIESWRKAWGQGDFPFLFAQLASYDRVVWDDSKQAWAFLRESQAHALELANTGMITLLDAGEHQDIHPQNKEIVGERFFMKARAVAYGEDIVSSGPVYESMQVEGASIVVTYRNVGQGLEQRLVSMPQNKTSQAENRDDPIRYLSSEAGKIAGFEVCGPDGLFVEAEAEIIGPNQIRIFSAAVSAPTQARYGWRNFAIANVYNKEGFPAEPFRTDTF